MNSSLNPSPILFSFFLLVFLYSFTVYLVRFLEAEEITVISSHCALKSDTGSLMSLFLSHRNCFAGYFYNCVMTLELSKFNNQRSLLLTWYHFCFVMDLWANGTGFVHHLVSSFTCLSFAVSILSIHSPGQLGRPGEGAIKKHEMAQKGLEILQCLLWKALIL